MGVDRAGGGSSRTGPLRRLKLNTIENRHQNQADPQQRHGRSGDIAPVRTHIAMQRLIPIEAVAVAGSNGIEQQIEIGGARQGSIFERGGTGPPNYVAIGIAVLHHGRLAGAAVLGAMCGISDLPCGFGHHPDFAATRQRIEAFGFQAGTRQSQTLWVFRHPHPATDSRPIVPWQGRDRRAPQSSVPR